MRKLPLVLNLICLPVFADVSAYLDRNTITAQDRVRLTLEADSRIQQEIDFSPLYRDFQFLGSKQLTLSSHAGGDSQYRTRWEVLLRPKSAGDITVPPLLLGLESSNSLQLKVLSGAARESGLQGEQVFIEASLDTNEVYQDSQLIYTLRLYHAIELLPDTQLTDPYLPGALIKPLGEQTRSTQQLRGRNYSVIEQRYALFPGQTGTLTLDGPIFEGRAKHDNSQIQLQARPLEVAVIAPAYQSARGYWLPATTLTLDDDWQSRQTTSLGESLSYSISLTATGLPASRLPSLAPPAGATFDLSVDSVELVEDVSERGLTSRRTEHIVLHPHKAGPLTLAPVDITWWDLNTDSARNVALPEHPLQVQPRARAVEAALALAPATPAARTEIDSAAVTAASVARLQQALNESRLLIGLLTVISLISSLGWLYTFNHLRQLRQEERQQAQQEEMRRRRKLLMAHQMAEKNTFQALAMACQQNNAAVAKLRLVEWAQNFWPDQHIFNSEDISDAARSQTLDFLILDLEQHVHQEDKALWQGDLLLEAIEKLRDRRPEGYEEAPLPELNFAS
ncbi:BatD family protein [Marinobacterium rhizophilum]|uniref:BatD family protein n=1 Tax=Marinobacterium rhizophilum TaxID=420402 RepID=A0ABY5HMW4_9GAMM|nr:BatD family protein [Marinobacterium rhizophilum]UTW13767.1 BatD family protein [Marinobacterium rhizophilum]